MSVCVCACAPSSGPQGDWLAGLLLHDHQRRAMLFIGKQASRIGGICRHFAVAPLARSLCACDARNWAHNLAKVGRLSRWAHVTRPRQSRPFSGRHSAWRRAQVGRPRSAAVLATGDR